MLQNPNDLTCFRSCSLCWSLQTESVTACTEIRQRMGFQSVALVQEKITPPPQKKTWVVLELKKGITLVVVGWQEKKKGNFCQYIQYVIIRTTITSEL